MIWLFLAGAILCETAATMCLRASDGLRSKAWLVPVVGGYVAAFALLSAAIAGGLPISSAYGIWAACGVALAVVGARVFFGERLNVSVIAGVLLVSGGVLLIEFGASR